MENEKLPLTCHQSLIVLSLALKKTYTMCRITDVGEFYRTNSSPMKCSDARYFKASTALTFASRAQCGFYDNVRPGTDVLELAAARACSLC